MSGQYAIVRFLHLTPLYLKIESRLRRGKNRVAFDKTGAAKGIMNNLRVKLWAFENVFVRCNVYLIVMMW